MFTTLAAQKAAKPRNIGRYQVKQELDHGGMSVVYLARDPRFQRDVAIKVLSRNLLGQANIRARFEREARIIASLDHPSIVQVYDVGEDEGAPFLVMRYMPGGSLSDLLTYGRLNLNDTARIAERLGGALDVAHAKGVVHRDLKPANILFDANGDAFLTDFGIVKLFENETNPVNMTGSVVLGTPAYMSPEQALGKPIDKRSDVYSLGAVMYEMLTGVPPYKGPSSVSVAMKHVMDPVPHVKEYRQDIPDALDAIVARAMAKEANDRQPGAGALAQEFSRAVNGLPAEAQTNNIPAAATRKPITEAGARLKRAAEQPVSAPNTPPAATLPRNAAQQSKPAAQPSEYGGRRDTVMSGNNRMLAGIAAVAGVLALLGIGMWVLSTIIGGGAAPPNGAIDATPTNAIIIPPPGATNTPSESSTAAPGIPVTSAPIEPSPTKAPDNKPQPIMDVVDGLWNVRSGPGTVYAIIGRVREPDRLTCVAIARGLDNRTWYEIKLNDGQRAWLREDAVRITSANLAAFDMLPPSQNIPPTPVPTSTPLPTITPTPTNTPTRTPTVVSGTATATPIPLIIATSAAASSTPAASATPTLAPSATSNPTPAPTATTAPTTAPAP
jgi:serine/threonine protein kinase